MMCFLLLNTKGLRSPDGKLSSSNALSTRRCRGIALCLVYHSSVKVHHTVTSDELQIVAQLINDTIAVSRTAHIYDKLVQEEPIELPINSVGLYKVTLFMDPNNKTHQLKCRMEEESRYGWDIYL